MGYMTLTSDKSKSKAFRYCLLGFIGIGGIHDGYRDNAGAPLRQ